MIPSLITDPAELRSVAMRTGAALLRGQSIGSAAELHLLLVSLGVEPVRYLFGQSPRTRVFRRVYTASEYPQQHEVPLHHELSYLPSPPELIFFLAERPAESGGAAIIADGRAIAERLGRDLCDLFDRRGVRYLKRMHSGGGAGKSWQQHFETTDRGEVEAFLHESGARFEWCREGELAVELQRPAISLDGAGRPVWFNQLHLWWRRDPLHATFGDGAEIPNDLVAQIESALEAAAVEVRYERGDLLVLDNRIVAHGRRPFEGDRRILVAMA